MGCYVNISPDCSVLDIIKGNFKDMFFAEAKVAKFITEYPEKALESNVSETAELSGVSDATVIRFCKKLGFGGFYQMKLQLSHDLGKGQRMISNPVTNDFKSPCDVILNTAQLISTIAHRLDPADVAGCIDAINRSDIIYAVGSGQSKILAHDILFRLTRLGYRTASGSFFGTDIENIYRGTKEDVLICVSHSGETKKTIQALNIASLRGMTTIALADSEKNLLTKNADYSLVSGIWDRQDNVIITNYSYIGMLAIIDSILNFVAKRQNDSDTLIDAYLAESRM
jgi:RpiR family carbohydrate utilization transcriptional regulator